MYAVIFTVFTSSIAAGVVNLFHFVVLFYEGTHLPMDIFSEFLSIPATATLLGRMSYSDVQNLLSADTSGSGQLFGSALVGAEDLFLDALIHWRNFSLVFKDDPALSATNMAITPVL